MKMFIKICCGAWVLYSFIWVMSNKAEANGFFIVPKYQKLDSGDSSHPIVIRTWKRDDGATCTLVHIPRTNDYMLDCG